MRGNLVTGLLICALFGALSFVVWYLSRTKLKQQIAAIPDDPEVSGNWTVELKDEQNNTWEMKGLISLYTEDLIEGIVTRTQHIAGFLRKLDGVNSPLLDFVESTDGFDLSLDTLESLKVIYKQISSSNWSLHLDRLYGDSVLTIDSTLFHSIPDNCYSLKTTLTNGKDILSYTCRFTIKSTLEQLEE